jgi:hypothetical protein
MVSDIGGHASFFKWMVNVKLNTEKPRVDLTPFFMMINMVVSTRSIKEGIFFLTGCFSPALFWRP